MEFPTTSVPGPALLKPPEPEITPEIVSDGADGDGSAAVVIATPPAPAIATLAVMAWESRRSH